MRLRSVGFVLLVASGCGGATRRDCPAPLAPAASIASSAPAPAVVSAPRQATDRTTFHLQKLLKEIGLEDDTTTPTADSGIERKATFSFRDRSTPVTLAASWTIDASGTLRTYATWGATSRSTHIDDRVERQADGRYAIDRTGHERTYASPSMPFAAASGYAPALGQALLLETWIASGRPAKVALLPAGEVTIESRGKETYDGEDGKKVTLEHVGISGLTWGREDAWLDEAGKLAAVVTRDAEFDHFEMAREGFVSLTPALAKSSGADGVAWLAQAGKDATRAAADVYALTGATLIDGTGRPPVKDAVVVVRGGSIAAAGPRATTPVPPGASVLDVSGKTIVPGLWDMHAHVEQVEQGAEYLATGVTTVRDVGNILDFITGIRDAVDAGRGLGPRVLVAGFVDGAGEAAIGTMRIEKAEDVVPVLDRLKKAGCLEVKIYSSVSPALVPLITRGAHARGMDVTGHVPMGMNAQQALDAGYDAINHIKYLVLDGVSEAQRRSWSRAERFRRLAAFDLQSPPMQKLYKTLLAKHAFLDDTIALYELFMHTDAEDAANEPGIAKMPRELEGMLGGVDPSLSKEAAAAFDKYVALLSELHKRGVTIVPGTDIAVPGHSLHRELELYVKAGFTPMEAIVAATATCARVMHLDKEAGTIEAGKRADLLVIDGDPLADIRALRNVVTTIAQGKVYDPAALARLVGFKP